jgi:NAD+ kinase
MRVAVVSWGKRLIEKELKKAGLDVTGRRPDVVICVGGEGTFLFGELEYPGVPKLLIKHRCAKCKSHDYGDVLDKLAKGRYKVEEHGKLKAVVNGNARKSVTAMNDINIHYALPCAVGIDVSVNGEPITRNLLGDGLVVSTPWGSPSYYRSITGKTFSKGMGLAFNNPVDKTANLVVPDASIVEVKITKGEGRLACDCSKKVMPLKVGDMVEIRKSHEPARIIRLQGHGIRVDI